MSTIKTLREHFAKEIPQYKPEIGDDDSLLENGVLDSMAIVKLIAFLEEQFDVQLTDEEFDPDNFETLKAIEQLIESKRAEG